MPSEYLPPPEAEFAYDGDWKEAVDNTQPGGGDHVTGKEQEAVLVGYVPYDKVLAAEKWFLGHTWCDAGSPYRLHRRPPCRHPRRPHLYAHSFSSVGIGPKSRDDNPQKETYRISEWTDPDGYPLYYADYQWALCTVRFKSYGGRTFFLDDTLMPEAAPWHTVEWQRFAEITIGPQTQSLQADGSSQLAFAEGDASQLTVRWQPLRFETVGGPLGQAFPAPLAELMARTNVRVRWLNVPHEYLSKNLYYLRPDKILGCLGKVSSKVHVGHPAGTMLLLGAEFDPTLMPLVSDDPDIPLTGWDVTLSYEQFDPEKGVPGSEYRGHRLFPWSVNGKWFYATREGADPGAGGGDPKPRELLPLADLDEVFRHVDDTDP